MTRRQKQRQRQKETLEEATAAANADAANEDLKKRKLRPQQRAAADEVVKKAQEGQTRSSEGFDRCSGSHKDSDERCSRSSESRDRRSGTAVTLRKTTAKQQADAAKKTADDAAKAADAAKEGGRQNSTTRRSTLLPRTSTCSPTTDRRHDPEGAFTLTAAVRTAEPSSEGRPSKSKSRRSEPTVRRTDHRRLAMPPGSAGLTASLITITADQTEGTLKIHSSRRCSGKATSPTSLSAEAPTGTVRHPLMPRSRSRCK